VNDRVSYSRNGVRVPRFLPWILDNPGRAAVWVSIALLLYQAALPGGLTLDPAARTITWDIFPSASFHLSRADVIGNIVPYAVFAHFVFMACKRRSGPWRMVAAFTFAATVLMALSVEFVQYFNLSRGSAVWDVISGAIGGVFGVLSGTFYVRKVSERFQRWLNIEMGRNSLFVAAAFLAALLLWDAARPFYIVSSADALFSNIKQSVVIPFEPAGRDIRVQLGLHPSRQIDTPTRSPDYWGKVGERLIAYGTLFGLLLFSRRRNVLKSCLLPFLAVLGAVEIISLLVVNSHMDITRIVIGLISMPIAFFFKRLCDARSPRFGLALMLIVCTSYIVISDLRPYEFSDRTAVGQDWFVPLMTHVKSVDVMLLANIIEAVVIFSPLGMVFFLLLWNGRNSRSGSQRLYAFLACLFSGILAGVLEYVQLWIPDRTSTLEDILYAILGSYIGVLVAKIYLIHRFDRLQVSAQCE
jgi:VanZ family protein